MKLSEGVVKVIDLAKVIRRFCFFDFFGKLRCWGKTASLDVGQQSGTASG